MVEVELPHEHRVHVQLQPPRPEHLHGVVAFVGEGGERGREREGERER